MKEHNITLGGETFRLTYNIKTSAALIEAQRPDSSIAQLLDSPRLQDMILLTVAGLDETHLRDRRRPLTQSQLAEMIQKVMTLVDLDMEAGRNWREAFVDMKRAIGASGIAGWVFEISDDGSVREGKAEPATVTAAD